MNHLSNIEATNFAKSVNVSRETLAKFQLYAELLKHWQKKINLIGSNTTDSLWERHFLDSAQLMRCIPKNLGSGPVYDIGSGAGFPGLVLAIMGLKHMHLVDSDSRKCVFLNEVVRQTNVNAHVTNARFPIETKRNLYPKASLIVARALAPLPKLLDIVFPVISSTTCCIFLKGARSQQEILDAKHHWHFKLKTFESQTSENGKILILSEVSQNGSGAK